MSSVKAVTGHISSKRPGHLALAFLYASLVILASCEGSRPKNVFSGSTMGTTWSIQISEPIRTQQDGDVQTDAERILEDINGQMSTYLPDSELSQLNAAPLGSEVTISASLFNVLSMSQRIHQESGGAFDITVGLLVNLWGFGPHSNEKKLPDALQLKSMRARVGMDGLTINGSHFGATRAKDVALDLSAIAKGYAVDRLARQLYKVGYRNFLVEVGGELRASGTNQRGDYWTIGIETPSLQRGVPFHAAPLNNKSIATSGDYRNFYEVDGRRYSHTVDPRSGAPVRHALASVTVLHNSAAEADGWATALNVLGPDEGLSLANELDLAAYFIIRDQQGFTAKESRAFTEYNEPLIAQAKVDQTR